MDNKNNPLIDIKSFIDQTVDTVLDKQLLAEMEKKGDETGIAIIQLCREYDIRGLKLMEFIYKLGMICDLTKKNLDEEVEDDG